MIEVYFVLLFLAIIGIWTYTREMSDSTARIEGLLKEIRNELRKQRHDSPQ